MGRGRTREFTCAWKSLKSKRLELASRRGTVPSVLWITCRNVAVLRGRFDPSSVGVEGRPRKIGVAVGGERASERGPWEPLHAKGGQVGVPDLGVEHSEATCAEVVDEVNEADLGCVGAAKVRAAEHRLSTEDGADGDAVQAADERGALSGLEPCLDGVGVDASAWAFPMERGVEACESG